MQSTGIGASAPRKEDDRFLRGRGNYVADIKIAGMRDLAFVRSPVAHADLKGVHWPDRFDGSVFAASEMADVLPIRATTSLPGFKNSTQPILCDGHIRHVGELIAVCVADDRAGAEDIAAEVTLDYTELPAVSDMLAATQPGVSPLHEECPDNTFIEFFHDGPVGEAIERADVKVSRVIRTSRQCMFPMEGRGVVAYHDERLGLLTVVTSTQMPHIVQMGVAECLGIEKDMVRIVSPDVGGGFGYKGLLTREEVAVAWLARHLGHAVRWLEDCREHLTANANCREHHYDITAYADGDGRLLAVDCEAHVDAGAYSVYPTSSALEAAQVSRILPGPYIMEVYRCRAKAVATNKCPILPYRGVARSGVCLAIESLMDGIAHELELEPYEVRLRNLIQPEQMPFDNVVGTHIDSGDYPECLRRAVAAIDIEGVRARQRRGEADERLLGVGMSIFHEQAAHGTQVLASWGRPVVPGYEQAKLRLTVDGGLEIWVGTHSHGQGHETTLAQVAHEILGIPLQHIRVRQGDTLFSPFSTGTWGSRSIVMAGGAVAKAARVLAGRIAHIGSALLQAEPDDVTIEEGRVAGPANSMSMEDVARAWYLQPQNLPGDLDVGGLEVVSGYRAERDSGTFSYACHAVTVAVDTQTGLIEILDYVVVEDGGVLVNPMVVDGQIRGGTVQGIGTGLYEAVPFDGQGQPLASTLLDYFLPGCADAPEIRIEHMETSSPYTEFGIKGIGEGGAVGPPAAIVSAVNDALRPVGVELYDLPLSPDRVLGAILEARQGD